MLLACAAAAIMDLRRGRLPVIILAAALGVGLGGSIFCLKRGFFWSLGGVLWGGGLPLATAAIYGMITGREGLGGGDVVLLGCVGAYVGAVGVLLVLFLTCLLALGGGLILGLTRRKPVRLRLAPYVLGAVLIHLFFGRIVT
jgi:leader peptidase (prepilin peptidase)/N-methyltransferase